MPRDSILDSNADGLTTSFERWVGVYIGILAVLLAICGMGGGNAAKDATRANIDAANMWAFFQAKNVRRTVYETAATDLELTLLANPTLPEAARKAIEEKVRSYRETVARFTTDKKTMEGLDELWEKAKAMEKDRDAAMRKDPYFDWATAMLQIALALASVSIVANSRPLLRLSAVLAVMGTLLTVNGFTLFMKIPFVG